MFSLASLYLFVSISPARSLFQSASRLLHRRWGPLLLIGQEWNSYAPLTVSSDSLG